MLEIDDPGMLEEVHNLAIVSDTSHRSAAHDVDDRRCISHWFGIRELEQTTKGLLGVHVARAD